MLELEPERAQSPKFPYEVSRALSVPDIQSIISKE